MKKRIVSAILTFLMLFASLGSLSFAQSNIWRGFEWSYNDGVLTVSGNGEMPDESSYPWHTKEVINNAKEVVVEEGITSVSYLSFWGLKKLEKITLPEGITSIKDRAFCNSPMLKSIKLPDSLTFLGTGTFANCTSLESISIPSGVEIIRGETFDNCISLKNVILNEGLKRITSDAFRNCVSLTEITIPDSIEEVYAFPGCTSLANINFPDKYFETNIASLKGTPFLSDPNNYENGQLYIGKTLISDTSSVDCVVKEGTVVVARGSLNPNVSSISIPASVERIEDFSYGSITVDENNKTYCAVDNILFSKDMKTLYMYNRFADDKRYVVPKTVEYIENSAFMFGNLEEIVLQEGVRHVYDGAFTGKNIKKITFPDSVKYISLGAFDLDDMYRIDDRYSFVVYPMSYADELIKANLTVWDYPDAVDYVNGEYRPMSDIDTKSWYADSVEYCVSRNFMIGTGKDEFSPHMNMTREQFVTLLARVMGADLSKYGGATGFKDAPAGKWYSSAVKWASEENVVCGIGEGRFGIGNKIDREQALTILYRLYDGEKAIKENSEYTDYKDVSAWALDAVNWGINNKIITSTVKGELRISPQMPLTRAQTATIIMHYHKGKFGVIESY